MLPSCLSRRKETHPIDKFDYDRAFVLNGTLVATHGTVLHTRMAGRFPGARGDAERECTVTALSDTTVQICVRDAALVREPDLLRLVLAAAPDTHGTLALQWPYTEIQEHTLPVDLRFLPDRVELVDYLLQPAVTSRAFVDSPR